MEDYFDEMFLQTEFKNEHIKAVIKAFAEDDEFRRQYTTSTCAARVHHAHKGGLIRHVYECYNMAKFLADLYPDQIDRDLLIAGMLLHDIGCIKAC